MELFTVSLCLFLMLIFLLHLLPLSKPTNNLPPGPSRFFFLANFIFHRKSFFEFGHIISNLRYKYGPLITVYLGSQPTIFITSNTLAHQAFVQNGAVFIDRPESTHKLFAGHQWKLISTSGYGPTWRALRRNLTGGILNPTHLKSFSLARKRVVENLIAKLKHDSESENNKAVYVAEHFRYAIFSMSVLLCFGDDIDHDKMKEIQSAQNKAFSSQQRLMWLFMVPSKLGKFFFRKLWNELNDAIKNCNDLFLSMIRSRKEQQSRRSKDHREKCCLSYVDTLLDFQLPGEEENIDENNIVELCNEFISAGTDAITSALQWIMACIVKYPSAQNKIFDEMKGVLGHEKRWVQEDDLQELPYLRAVVLEVLRLHPPSYAPPIPRAVLKDVDLGGYTIHKGTAVNFLIPEMGRDPSVWEDPMEFKPERFIKSDVVDSKEERFGMTGKGEIKMMPFGAGRRICPGNGLALLHLTYIAANLVWCFDWSPPDGQEIDLTEKYELSISLKHPLMSCLTPRSFTCN